MSCYVIDNSIISRVNYCYRFDPWVPARWSWGKIGGGFGFVQVSMHHPQGMSCLGWDSCLPMLPTPMVTWGCDPASLYASVLFHMRCTGKSSLLFSCQGYTRVHSPPCADLPLNFSGAMSLMRGQGEDSDQLIIHTNFVTAEYHRPGAIQKVWL